MMDVPPSRRTLVASDWHLGHFSPPAATRLATGFLEHALLMGDDVILNGDIFEGMFESSRAAESAQPTVCALISELSSRGRLCRTEGNHDPGSGVPELVLTHPTLGRVLVAHGHAADPMQRTLSLRLGNAVSRRFGRLRVVRGAGRLAESTAMLLGGPIEAMFRDRCIRLVDAAGCALGIFGHVHRQYVVSGDRYANAGRLRPIRLEYLALGPSGIERLHLGIATLDSREASPRRPSMMGSWSRG